MTGRIITPDRYRRMRWKNGGGETVEIGKFPPNADLDSFGWRVSMATVGSDGPFSAFEGVERTLSILSGTGISLAIGNSDPVMLGPGSEPFSFPADTTATARLIDGPITDFNVMTRRRDWRHTVRKVHVPTGDALTIGPVAAQTIVFCRNGTFEVNDGTDTALLSESATLWIGRDGDPWVLRATKSGMAFVVEIDASDG